MVFVEDTNIGFIVFLFFVGRETGITGERTYAGSCIYRIYLVVCVVFGFFWLRFSFAVY